MLKENINMQHYRFITDVNERPYKDLKYVICDHLTSFEINRLILRYKEFKTMFLTAIGNI